MPRLTVACALLLLMSAVQSQPRVEDGDPLHSSACRQALAALGEQEAAASAGAEAKRSAQPRLAAARQRAALICLASRTDRPAPAGRVAEPPVAVPPIARPAAPRPTQPMPPLPPVTPPARPAPPVVITACDDGGCWASDGSRLQRVGPNLLGPRGLCQPVGALLHCP